MHDHSEEGTNRITHNEAELLSDTYPTKPKSTPEPQVEYPDTEPEGLTATDDLQDVNETRANPNLPLSETESPDELQG